MAQMFLLLSLEPMERQCTDYQVHVAEDKVKEGALWKRSSQAAAEQVASTGNITQLCSVFFCSSFPHPACRF